MRFCSLGSGSGGNATLVEAGRGASVRRVLIDCGFSLRELTLRLARIGLACDDLDAIFVTHEHGDHIGCGLTLARKHRLPVWMSRGTWRAIGEADPSDMPELLRFARDGEAITVGDLQLMPFTVVHDALEPLQLRCSDGDKVLGVLTDVGSVTPHLLAHLQGCDALLLECNHDAAMLAASSYPWPLKQRVGGRFGHLSNDRAAQILRACMHGGLKHLVAAHLSAQNNLPALAQQALADACGAAPDDIVVADQRQGFAWLGLASHA
jgi:phosphoribosyl 1,2-cyclic phosphodiesterase